MVSRRRRRQGIGKIIVSVESRVRRIERRPSPKRLKTNVVTTDKLGFRAVTTKTVAPDAITPNEAAFGTTVVTDTQPTEYLKEGTTWVNPDDGATNVYSTDLGDFVTVTDAAAVSIAQGKSKTYVQDNEPTGGTYSLGDLWIDTNDGNKLYAYTGSAWAAKQDGSISTAQSTADGKNKVNYSTSDPGSTPNTAGDIWWKYASGIVIAQWTGAGGTTWTSNTIGNTVIASLDAGKITTGFLSVAGSVKIGTNPSGSGTSARVEINSTGFYAYDGSVATVSITNTGTAVFSGSIYSTLGTIGGWTISADAIEKTHSGVTIELDATNGYIAVADGTNTAGIDTPSATGGTVFWAGAKPTSGNGPGTSPNFYVKTTGELHATDGYLVNGNFSGSISSTATITGGSFKTASSGLRLEIAGGNIYTYDGSEQQGVISSTTNALYFYGPGSTLGAGGKMQLYSDAYALSGLVSLTAGGTGDVTMTTATNLLRIDGATTAVTLTGSTPVGTFGLRNIRGYTSFTPGTSGGIGTDGDIVVVYS